MPSAIPYRSDAVLSAASLAPALAWTCVVLVTFVVVVLLLKKKGVIARWQGGSPLTTATGAIIRRAEYRLNRSTVVYLLEIEGENVVIAQSKGQLSVQRLGQATGTSK